MLEDVLDVFAERAHKKGLDLGGIVHLNVPNTLKGDPNRLTTNSYQLHWKCD